MGAWSETIMGGDTPHDLRGCLLEKIEEITSSKNISETDANFKELLAKSLPTLYQLITVKRVPKKVTDTEETIFYHKDRYTKYVLGVLIIESGIKSSKPFVKKSLKLALKAVEEELADKEDLEDWRSPRKRIHRLQEFKLLLENYKGTIIKVPNEHSDANIL